MFPRENKKVRTVNSKTNLHIKTHKNVGGKRKSSFYNFTRVRDKKRLEKVGNLVKNSYLYR